MTKANRSIEDIQRIYSDRRKVFEGKKDFLLKKVQKYSLGRLISFILFAGMGGLFLSYEDGILLSVSLLFLFVFILYVILHIKQYGKYFDAEDMMKINE